MTQDEKLIIIKHFMQAKKEVLREIALLEQQAKVDRFPVPSPYYHQAKGKLYALQNLMLALGFEDSAIKMLQGEDDL